MKLILTFEIDDLDDPTHVGEWMERYNGSIAAGKKAVEAFDGFKLIKTEVTNG
jgi:hypothetical protein